MSSEPVKNRCPPTCPKVKKQLRAALAEAPWLADGIFPRKKNDVDIRVPSDILRDVRDEVEPVIKMDVSDVSKAVEDVIETKPIEEERIIQELTIIEEQPVIPIKKITDRDFEKIDLIKKKELIEEPTIIEEQEIVPIEEIIVDHDVKKIDLIEEKELIQEPIIIPEQAVVPIERITDNGLKKIDLVEDIELTQESIIIEDKQPLVPIEKIIDHDIEKIDLIEEKIIVPEKIIMEPKIIEDEVDQVAPAEVALESLQEPEEYFEPKEPIEDYDINGKEEKEETRTDYERFIDEEMEKALPSVIAKEIPEEPKMIRKIPENAVLHEKDDRKRPIRPPKEREVKETAIFEEPRAREETREDLVISPRAERVVPSKRTSEAVEDACDETCPLVKEQKERIIRKLKERQRVDHYYLTKGFRYFEDVCTCSLACMVYSLSRDPFVRSIFASLTLFAIGLKLCSELDAWEMPSRVS